MQIEFEPGDCFFGLRGGVKYYGIVFSRHLTDRQASVIIFETKNPEKEKNYAIFLPDEKEVFNEKKDFFPIQREYVPYTIAVELDRCYRTWLHAQENLEMLEASRDSTE